MSALIRPALGVIIGAILGGCGACGFGNIYASFIAIDGSADVYVVVVLCILVLALLGGLGGAVLGFKLATGGTLDY